MARAPKRRPLPPLPPDILPDVTAGELDHLALGQIWEAPTEMVPAERLRVIELPDGHGYVTLRVITSHCKAAIGRKAFLLPAHILSRGYRLVEEAEG